MNQPPPLNENFSTTRLLTKSQPVIETKLEDPFATVLLLPESEGRQGEGGLRTNGYFKASLRNKPLITLVTVVFNGEKFLEETIQSIINQTYDNVEYIIIDGGSTDGTLDIIRQYEHAIDYWISEKDNGIYDAMNKGAKLSSGLFIGFINADDFLYLNTISTLVTGFIENEFDYTFGAVDIYGLYDEYKETFFPINNIIYWKESYISMPSPHQAIFIRINLFKEVGGFDLRFKLSADYDLILSVISSSKKVWYFPDSVGVFRLGGASGSYDTFLENFKLLKKHDVGFFKRNIVTFESLIKVFIINSLPDSVINFLRKINPSGRFKKIK